MPRFFLPIILIAMAAAVGCKDDASVKSGLVGVVDIQRVSNAMGWTDAMRVKAEQAQSHGMAQVQAYVKPMKQAYEKKRDEIAAAHKFSPDKITDIDNAKRTADLEKLGLSKAEIDDLMQLLMTWSSETASANALLSQTIATHQQAMAAAILQAAGPSVRRVAAANNRGVIITPAGNLLYNDIAASLTDKVVDDLQHSSSAKLDLPDMRELKFPASNPATHPAS